MQTLVRAVLAVSLVACMSSPPPTTNVFVSTLVTAPEPPPPIEPVAAPWGEATEPPPVEPAPPPPVEPAAPPPVEPAALLPVQPVPVVTDACRSFQEPALSDVCGSSSKLTADAAALFEKACDAVDAKACAQLARAYRCGGGVPQDLARSIALSEKACDERDYRGCEDLELAIPSVEPATAFRFAKKACAGAGRIGAPWACERLAVMYREGIGTPKDPPRAEKLIEQECGVEHANNEYRPWPCCNSCNSGNPGACYRLGWLYLGSIDKGDVVCPHGSGCRADHDKAAALFKRACDMGLTRSCTELAQLISSPHLYH